MSVENPTMTTDGSYCLKLRAVNKLSQDEQLEIFVWAVGPLNHKR